LDYLRKEDWVPRSIRRQMKLYQEGIRLLKEKRLEKTDENLGIVLGLNKKEIRKLLFETQKRTVVSTEIMTTGLSDVFLEEVIEDKEQDVIQDLIQNENRYSLQAALQLLPERDRKVLEMYYFEGHNLKQIGKEFDITESRACQIRKTAVSVLQRKLASTVA